MCTRVALHMCAICGGQKTAFESWLSSFIVGSRLELSLLGLCSE